MSSLNIEACRQYWESDEQWELRKEFLETYKYKFNDAKLLCLSQVYTNMELLGCSYPTPVMLQIQDLAKGLKFSRERQQIRKAPQTIEFSKAECSRNSAKRVGHPTYLFAYKKIEFKGPPSKTPEITYKTIVPSRSQQLSMPVNNLWSESTLQQTLPTTVPKATMGQLTRTAEEQTYVLRPPIMSTASTSMNKEVRQVASSINRNNVLGLSRTQIRNRRRRRRRNKIMSSNVPGKHPSTCLIQTGGKSDGISTSTSSLVSNGQPPKQVKEDPASASFSKAVADIQIAVVKNGFPLQRLIDSEMDLVHREYLYLLDKAPIDEDLPLIRNFQLIGGAIIYTCGNSAARDWIAQSFEGRKDVVEGFALKVMLANELPKPIKVSLRTKNIWSENIQALLQRLHRYNEKLNTSNWCVLGHSMDGQYARWILQIDRESANVLAEAKYVVCTGLDDGHFKVLYDPDIQNNRATRGD